MRIWPLGQFGFKSDTVILTDNLISLSLLFFYKMRMKFLPVQRFEVRDLMKRS